MESEKTKICSECDERKILTEFYFRKETNNYRNDCKDCFKKRSRKYKNKNSNKIYEQNKKYVEANRESVQQYQREYREGHNNEIRESHKIYYAENKNKILDGQKKYREKNYEVVIRKEKEYRNKNREKIRARNRKLHIKNMKVPIYRLKYIIRSRFSAAIKNNYKSGSAVKDLGCSIEELKLYLEKQFYSNPETGEEMTWENQGKLGWHIDHIIPLSSFDLTDNEQSKKANHYTNLQPLWWKDNLQKGTKLNWSKK